MAGLGPQAQALTCRRGHYGWTDWAVIRWRGEWAVRALCDLGDHYLTMPHYDGVLVVSTEPDTWPSYGAAEEALRRYVEQQADARR